MQLVKEEKPCGCLLTQNTVDGRLFLSYCPKHAAADDLLEACIYARDEMVVNTEGENGAYHALEAAIARVEAQD